MNRKCKLLTVCAFVIFIAVIFIGKYKYDINENKEKNKKYVVKQINGNVSTNIVLGGELAEERGEIYYSNANDAWCLYVENLEGKNRKKLNDTRSDNINIANDCIYYRDVFNHRIMKMNLDGGKNKALYEGIINNLIYFEGYIYFIEDNNDKQFIVKLKDDGSVQEKLFLDNIFNLILYNGWFYYYNAEERSIKKVKMDGSSSYAIYKAEIDFFTVEKGYIYFTDKEKQKICRMDIEGNNISAIANISPDYLNILDGSVYYCNINDIIWKTEINKNRSRPYIKDNVLRFYITENALLYDFIKGDNKEKIYQKLLHI